MQKFLFMKSILKLLSQGKFFRKICSIFLRAIATVIILAGLAGFFIGWQAVLELPISGLLGGIIFQLLFIIAIYMVVHTLLIRAYDITNLPESEYIVIPITSIFVKLIGEVYACFASVVAIGGGILIWFAGSYAQSILKDLTPLIPSFGGETFVSGILFIMSGVLSGFFVLVFFYCGSEFMIVIVNIARDIKETRKVAEQYDNTKNFKTP